MQHHAPITSAPANGAIEPQREIGVLLLFFYVEAEHNFLSLAETQAEHALEVLEHIP
jgi:hypothetical protein